MPVSAGSIAKLLLSHLGVSILSHVVRIGEAASPERNFALCLLLGVAFAFNRGFNAQGTGGVRQNPGQIVDASGDAVLSWQATLRVREPTSPVTKHECRPSGPDPGLRVLAEAGGGGFFELDDVANLHLTFQRVADELHQQYLLGFDAPARDGRVHRLEVRLRRADLTARARTSYVAK